MEQFCRDAPFNVGVFSCVSSLPDILRQLGVISFVSMLEALIMVVETGFELRFTTTIIVSGSATGVESGFIDDRIFTATFFQWTIGFVPAVARWSGAAVICPVLEHFFVVPGYNCCHVWHAAVAHFMLFLLQICVICDGKENV